MALWRAVEIGRVVIQDAALLVLAMYADWTTAAMREKNAPPQTVTETNYNISYWTPAQMVAHHASNGCNLEPGYLFGSGTVSGPTDEARATIA